MSADLPPIKFKYHCLQTKKTEEIDFMTTMGTWKNLDLNGKILI